MTDTPIKYATPPQYCGRCFNTALRIATEDPTRHETNLTWREGFLSASERTTELNWDFWLHPAVAVLGQKRTPHLLSG